ncbi:ATP-binding protein [Streptomyces sp. NPDC050803]|uniref:ATP-binding protein n=1 Tax=unclassified Streptomyces TaxID=2593676 RepID=UPI00341F617B
MRTDHGRTTRPPGSGPGMIPAYVVCVVTMLSGIAWATLVLVHLHHPNLEEVRGFTPAAMTILVSFGYSLTGLVFVSRDPGRPLGRLLLAAGLSMPIAHLTGVTVAITGVGGPVRTASFLLDTAAYALWVSVLYTLPLWLPMGRLTRWTVGPAVIGMTYSLLQQYAEFAHPGETFYQVPTPLDQGVWARVEDTAGWLYPVINWVSPILIATSLLVMALHWRFTPRGERAYAFLLGPYLPLAAFLCLVNLVPLPADLVEAAYLVAATAWPITLGYVHVRDRTWALDRAGRRVMTSLVLTFVLFVAYLAGGLVLSLLAPGAVTPRALMAVCVAVLVGALLRPTARWAAALVERRYYGKRAEPYQAVQALADRLGHALDPGDIPRVLCDTVVHTLGLPAARLDVRTRRGHRELARLGAPGAGDEVFPLVHRGAEIGYLRVPPRPGELALDRQDREAVRILADHSAPALASLQLYEDLQTSREQIVLAREEERRRLRHDLHDGLGPALSGLRLQIDAIRAAAPDRTARLRTISEGIGTAIDELRHITAGLAPAALDGTGLSRALHQTAESLAGRELHIDVDLEPEPFPRLPAAVEVAVYRITAEALNNAVRHSRGDRARLRVTLTGETVTVEIGDNGRGVPDPLPDGGVGLHSMAERAAELGGTFIVRNTGAGTVVRAQMPTGADGRPGGDGTAPGPGDHAPGTESGQNSWRKQSSAP